MNWYNENIKIEFVNQYEGIVSDTAFDFIFKKSYPLEIEMDKDCSQFNLEDILDLARSFRSSDIGSLRVKISLLKSYTQFCIDRGMSKTGLNHYSEVTLQMLKESVDQKKMADTYITRKEVEELTRLFENPRDQYVVLAPYEGIYGPGMCEVIELREKDLLGNNRVRLCTGREITVSKMLYDIMLDSASLFEITDNNTYKKRKLQDTDKIYKGIQRKRAEEIDERHLRRKYTRMKHFLHRSTFGGRMLYTSGLMNEIDKAVIEYGDIYAAKDAIIEIKKKYNASYRMDLLRRMYREAISIKKFH